MLSISYSAAQRYLLSPMSFFLHYYLRLRPQEQGSALFFGSAVDSGLNSLLEDKRDGREVDVEKAKAVFCNSFLKQEINGEEKYLYEPGVVKFSKADLDENLLTEDDINSGLNKSWLSLNRKGQIIIQEFYEQIIPKLEKVLLVQHNIELKNDSGDKFIGVVDFVAQIDGKVWIVDNKTSSITYKPDSANESAQLATYYEALREEYDLTGVMFCVISKKVRRKKLPQIEITLIPGQVSEQLIEATFEDYDKVLTGVKTGQFACSPEKCCATPWGCAYKTWCQSGGKDMTGLVYHKERK